jgi:hypothetical protein
MYREELKRIAKRIASTVSLKLVSPWIKPAVEAILDANAKKVARIGDNRRLCQRPHEGPSVVP